MKADTPLGSGKYLLAVCLQPSPLRRPLVNIGSYKVKVFFLVKLFEEGIYYVCRGDVFVVTLNVLFPDVTKHVFFKLQYSPRIGLWVILI